MKVPSCFINVLTEKAKSPDRTSIKAVLYFTVVRLGFEPRLTESESVVLPLHNRTLYFGVQC